MTFNEWADSIFKYGSDADYGLAKAAWDAATKEEREACIGVCDGVLAELGKYDGSAADLCGDRIRNRAKV